MNHLLIISQCKFRMRRLSLLALKDSKKQPTIDNREFGLLIAEYLSSMTKCDVVFSHMDLAKNDTIYVMKLTSYNSKIVRPSHDKFQIRIKNSVLNSLKFQQMMFTDIPRYDAGHRPHYV